jgi:hypothetical protein
MQNKDDISNEILAENKFYRLDKMTSTRPLSGGVSYFILSKDQLDDFGLPETIVQINNEEDGEAKATGIFKTMTDTAEVREKVKKQIREIRERVTAEHMAATA